MERVDYRRWRRGAHWGVWGGSVCGRGGRVFVAGIEHVGVGSTSLWGRRGLERPCEDGACILWRLGVG